MSQGLGGNDAEIQEFFEEEPDVEGIRDRIAQLVHDVYHVGSKGETALRDEHRSKNEAFSTLAGNYRRLFLFAMSAEEYEDLITELGPDDTGFRAIALQYRELIFATECIENDLREQRMLFIYHQIDPALAHLAEIGEDRIDAFIQLFNEHHEEGIPAERFSIVRLLGNDSIIAFDENGLLSRFETLETYNTQRLKADRAHTIEEADGSESRLGLVEETLDNESVLSASKAVLSILETTLGAKKTFESTVLSR